MRNRGGRDRRPGREERQGDRRSSRPGGFRNERPQADRPRGDGRRFQEDRPRGERPREDRPRGERPRAAASPERQGGRFIYGMNPVLEALRARPEEMDRLYIVEGQLAAKQAAELLSRAKEARVRVDRVPRERLASISEGGVHQGVAAEMREYAYADLQELLEAAKRAGTPPLIVVLDGVQDPHNLGAIVRSAHALGAHGVVVGKDRAAGVSGVVAKASAGAIEHCRVARVVNISRALEELKEAGLWIAAADVDGDRPLEQAKLDGPLALVVGAEGAGVREGVLSHCDFRLTIPMAGQVASLNASVSAGILLYEVSRQRRTVLASNA